MQQIAEESNSHEAQLSLAQLYLGIVREVPERRNMRFESPRINREVDYWLMLAAENGNEYANSRTLFLPVYRTVRIRARESR